jgi:hypothetical protein
MADSAEPAEAPPADPTVPAADADNAPAADPTTPAAEAPASGQTQDESSDPVGDLFREVDVDRLHVVDRRPWQVQVTNILKL